jgi:hypothetical protein
MSDIHTGLTIATISSPPLFLCWFFTERRATAKLVKSKFRARASSPRSPTCAGGALPPKRHQSLPDEAHSRRHRVPDPSTQGRYDQLTDRGYTAMAENTPTPVAPIAKTTRPMSEALLNEKVLGNQDTKTQIKVHLCANNHLFAVGSLPLLNAHPLRPRPLLRRRLLRAPVQATRMARIRRSRFRCWTGLGRVRYRQCSRDLVDKTDMC